jgi:hypothetical protein
MAVPGGRKERSKRETGRKSRERHPLAEAGGGRPLPLRERAGSAFWQSQSGEGKVDPRLQLPPALGCEFGLDLEVAFGLSFGGRAFGALDCASAETGSKPT